MSTCSTRPIAARTATALRCLAGSLAAAATLQSQCTSLWSSAFGVPGVTGGDVNAIARWDPDGSGPQEPWIVLAGTFTSANGIAVNHIVAWDGKSWLPLGSGLDNTVWSLCTMPNGDLIAVGAFTTAGGVNASRVARWNGAAWSPVGPGVNGTVFEVCVHQNEIIVGGTFTIAGTSTANHIARWDGAQWHAMGTGMNADVGALASLPNGHLAAGGWFTSAGGVSAHYLAEWNGATWAELGGGTGSDVYELLAMPNGDLVVGGLFASVGGAGGIAASNIARWNGSGWAPLGAGTNANVGALALLPNGDVVAGGNFTSAGGRPAEYVAHWDGAQWTDMGSGVTVAPTAVVYDLLALPDGKILMGGSFPTVGNSSLTTVNNVAIWGYDYARGCLFCGNDWEPIGAGPGALIFALATMPNGDLIVGGNFTRTTNLITYAIASYDGYRWNDIPYGLLNGFSPATVTDLLVQTDGSLVAIGQFVLAGGTAATNIARWDGSQWFAFGAGLPGAAADCLAQLTNGDLVAAGSFAFATPTHVMRWDGTAWNPLGGDVDGHVRDLASLPNGELLAAGQFNQAGGVAAHGIARWDGSAWHGFAADLGQADVQNLIEAIAVLPNGDVVAGGQFSSIGGVAAQNIARWDGSAWSPLGPGVPFRVFDIAVLPGGDLCAVGHGFGTASNVVRWDGSGWTAFGSGVPGPNSWVFAALMRDDGLYVAGDIPSAGGFASTSLAVVSTSCPPTAVPYGLSCSSSAGPVVLTADGLPWLGTTFHATATGFAPLSIGVQLVGLTQLAVPASLVHPAGLPACLLLVDPSLQLDYPFVPVAGAMHPSVQIPLSPFLVGLTGYLQVAQLELDPQLNILAVSSSNGLALTVGRF